jgi:serine/threonine protein kinase
MSSDFEVGADGFGESKNSFDIKKVLGEGSFGKVYEAVHKPTGKSYAMKAVSKRRIKENELVAYIRAERDIMTNIDHPFLMSLRCAYQTRTHLFMIMDHMEGGELFGLLEQQGTFTEEETRFYVAELILALQHLHGLQVVHRDIKPENVLLGADGYICLMDFGFAKKLCSSDAERVDGEADNGGESKPDETTKTICGTDYYMAPEMVDPEQSYGIEVDWWSLGVIFFEMLTGRVPFTGKNFKQVCAAASSYPTLTHCTYTSPHTPYCTRTHTPYTLSADQTQDLQGQVHPALVPRAFHPLVRPRLPHQAPREAVGVCPVRTDASLLRGAGLGAAAAEGAAAAYTDHEHQVER